MGSHPKSAELQWWHAFQDWAPTSEVLLDAPAPLARQAAQPVVLQRRQRRCLEAETRSGGLQQHLRLVLTARHRILTQVVRQPLASSSVAAVLWSQEVRRPGQPVLAAWVSAPR